MVALLRTALPLGERARHERLRSIEKHFAAIFSAKIFKTVQRFLVRTKDEALAEGALESPTGWSGEVAIKLTQMQSRAYPWPIK